MKRWKDRAWLIGSVSWASLTMIAMLSWHLPVAIRATLGLPLALFLPGYTLGHAVLGQRVLPDGRRIVLGLGLSLAIDVVGGGALHYTRWGLGAESWVVLLGLATIVAGIVALLRTPRSPKRTDSKTPVRARDGVLFGLALAVAVGAIILAQRGASRQSGPGYTQLWMLWADDSHRAVSLGIRSAERQPTAYRLRLVINDEAVHEWPRFELDAGEEWQARIDLVGEGEREVEAILDRLDPPCPGYRTVRLASPDGT